MFDRRPNCNPGADVSAAKEADTIDGQFQIRGKIRMTTTGPFELDPRLKADTLAITKLGLCELRLMNDRRWPWLLLVPQRAGVSEFFDLTPLDQTMLSFEVGLVAKPFKALTSSTSRRSAMWSASSTAISSPEAMAIPTGRAPSGASARPNLTKPKPPRSLSTIFPGP